MEFKKEKATERDIIIQTVMDLRAIAQEEFRGGFTNKIVSGNVVSEVYVPDQRKKYCQLVDFLGDLLLGDFDKDIKKEYKTISEEIEKLVGKKNKGELNDEDYMAKRLRISRRLLQHLFLLLKRIKWLKKKTTTG